MHKTMAIVALILSIVACALALWRHVDHARAARQALQDREAELIRHFTPNLHQIAADFDITGYPTNLKTLEEAFDPILRIIESVSSTETSE